MVRALNRREELKKWLTNQIGFASRQLQRQSRRRMTPLEMNRYTSLWNGSRNSYLKTYIEMGFDIDELIGSGIIPSFISEDFVNKYFEDKSK